MNNISSSALRRMTVLYRVLNQRPALQLNVANGSRQLRAYSTATTVTIGDISKPVTAAQTPQYIPQKYLNKELSQEALRHLRWMLQKDILGQDMFLIGRPGPLRRQLAMQYLEMTGRELEYVSLSRDTTEADLKQRREIQAGTAKYFDQSAVRAAIEGRILILEGIEKAERNVLPVLNNLLENREMHLEDGRFLIPASRYDKLLEEHSPEEMDRWNLVRVSEEFRVIALGIPVPRYVGNPLDPPLRSRFQARDIGSLSYKEQLEAARAAAPSVDPAALGQLLSCCHALLAPEAAAQGLPDFPADNVLACAELLQHHPGLSAYQVFCRLYPYKCFLGREGQRSVEDILTTFNLLPAKNAAPPAAFVQEVLPSPTPGTATVKISVDGRLSSCQVPVGGGGVAGGGDYVATPYQERLLAELTQSHASRDLCLIGPRGCGKSATVARLAAILNYQLEPIVLYQDMTSRDLVQQRSTLANGDTTWTPAPLVTAALEGKMAVLDGLHRIHPSTLGIVHRLAHDREMQLHDGRRLVRHDRYDLCKERCALTDAEMAESGILRIHPSFRVVALAEPSARGAGAGAWLSSELLSLFLFHEMRPLALDEEMHIINTKFGRSSEATKQVLGFAHKLRGSEDSTLQSLVGSLSTRQLLRVARRMAAFPGDTAADAVNRACLARLRRLALTSAVSRFLPSLAKKSLEGALAEAGIVDAPAAFDSLPAACRIDADTVTIGKTSAPRYRTHAKTKVPDILFYDIPQHVAALEWLLQDFVLGEHLLLVGNQGVGKNKLVDRLLQLMNRPREYIQLHRDTTVQTLTLQPTVRAGVVVYEDSPLVQAVKRGHVLVVDEADKAPTHVTCILKTLVESGEMILSDGRRIVPHGDPRAAATAANIVPVHPDFRMIVLANRPGFPFLGNDFFGALGDLFSCHSVDNPSPESEIALLRQYGPDVPAAVVSRLVKAFGELRQLADQGLVQYPYSTREVVNIVKHLQQFQEEGVAGVVGNVFDFDSYSPEVQDLLAKTLHKHGIPVGANPNSIGLAKEFPLPPPRLLGSWTLDATLRSQLSVEQRALRAKPSLALSTASFPLELVQARGLVFTEMQAHWDVPASETAVMAAIAVSRDPENNPSKDLVHVLTTNPLSLFTMRPWEESTVMVRLEGLLKPEYGTRPAYTAHPLSGSRRGTLLLHEQTTNGLLLVDSASGQATPLPLRSTLELATGNIARRLGGGAERWWTLAADCSDLGNLAVLHEAGGSTLEVLDIDSMQAFVVQLPFAVKSVHLASDQRWLLEDTEDRKYIVSKSTAADRCPSMLLPITESSETLGPVTACSARGLEYDALSRALTHKTTAPNRLLASDWSYAAVAVGFPDLDSASPVHTWPRPQRASPPLGATLALPDLGQMVRPVRAEATPPEAFPAGARAADVAGFLEVTDVGGGTLRYVAVPRARALSPAAAWTYGAGAPPLGLAAASAGGVVSLDAGGRVRRWETGAVELAAAAAAWRRAIGGDGTRLRLTVDRPSGADVDAPKHGKEDPKNEPHVGGNTWAGGTGGRDTAGLGGKGGPYRLDAGHTVHQVPQEEKDAVPEHVRKAAREMGRRAFQEKLREIAMSEYDAELYGRFSAAVDKQVRALRVILASLQAKAKERQWMRHQTSGELDDSKLVESLTGEKSIYRRRGDAEPELGSPQVKPKRLKLVVDVSGSMYRFNGYDGRLDRQMEAVVMVMEAFQGHEARIQYDIAGHSGESHDLTFVESKAPPRHEKDRLNSIKTMHAHAQFCMAGDNTLEATKLAIASLSKEDCDEAIVVVLSDANLERYGIPAEEFARVLTSDARVNAYAIFIGSLGDQAERLTSKLPAGKSFVCLDLKDIPQILQQIFAASVLNTR